MNFFNKTTIVVVFMIFSSSVIITSAAENHKKDFEKKNEVVNKVMDETGANVLNIQNKPSNKGGKTLKVKIIKDGQVKYVEKETQ